MDTPTDLWVGARVARWWDEPLGCSHSGNNVCMGCAELTAEEADAIREYINYERAKQYLRLLRAKTDSGIDTTR